MSHPGRAAVANMAARTAEWTASATPTGTWTAVVAAAGMWPRTSWVHNSTGSGYTASASRGGQARRPWLTPTTTATARAAHGNNQPTMVCASRAPVTPDRNSPASIAWVSTAATMAHNDTARCRGGAGGAGTGVAGAVVMRR